MTGIKERQDAEEDELLAGEDFHPNDSSHCLKSSDFDFDRLDRIDFQEENIRDYFKLTIHHMLKASVWNHQTTLRQSPDGAVIWLQATPDGCRLIKLMRPGGGPADQISAKTLLTRLMY